MKTSIIKTVTMCFLLIIALFTGCTKDTLIGPTGPAGPTGLAGPAGNANVEEYDLIVNNATGWSFNTLDSTWWVSYNTTINKTDAVMVYVVTGSVGTQSVYTALPYIARGVQTTFSNTLEYVYINVNSILGNVIVPNPGYQVFKIIIIPSSLRLANVNHNNFTEVKAAYHLKGK